MSWLTVGGRMGKSVGGQGMCEWVGVDLCFAGIEERIGRILYILYLLYLFVLFSVLARKAPPSADVDKE